MGPSRWACLFSPPRINGSEHGSAAVIIDASSVISLDLLGLLPQLSLLFSRVLLPKAVRTELFKRRDTKNRIQAVLNSYAFVERCDDYDKGVVDLLLLERSLSRPRAKDRGETEAVVRAAMVGASVVADDVWGRELAARFGRDCHGTLWVLQRFYELGLASPAATRDHFPGCANATDICHGLVNEFLLEIGQQPIDLDKNS